MMNGVDVAKDAAKIILLEKDLAVLNDGVIEGRHCFDRTGCHLDPSLTGRGNFDQIGFAIM